MRRLVLGRPDVVRGFVPVEVIVDAIVGVADHPHPGETINVCSGVGVRLADVVAAMAELLGVSFDARVDPALGHISAPEVVVGDPTRMEQLLGLRVNPTPASVAEALLADVPNGVK